MYVVRNDFLYGTSQGPVRIKYSSQKASCCVEFLRYSTLFEGILRENAEYWLGCVLVHHNHVNLHEIEKEFNNNIRSTYVL